MTSTMGWRGPAVALVVAALGFGAACAPARLEQASVTTPAGARVPAGAQAGVVERVIDGDTIAVRIDAAGVPLVAGATHTIRLLEIDTPETVAPGRGVECGGPEATAFAREQLGVGSTVHLVADREDTDRYGRFLRYVWTDDGAFFNELAVEGGYARSALYQPAGEGGAERRRGAGRSNDRYIDRLRAAETRAQRAGRGLWGPPCRRAPGAAQAATRPRRTSRGASPRRQPRLRVRPRT